MAVVHPDNVAATIEMDDYPWYIHTALLLFTIFSVPALIALPFWFAGFLHAP